MKRVSLSYFVLVLAVLFQGLLFNSISAQEKNSQVFYQDFYQRLGNEIQKNIDKTTRNRFPKEMKPETFLTVSFETMPYFARNKTLLALVNRIKSKYNQELQQFNQQQQTKEKHPKKQNNETQKKQSSSSLPWVSWILRELSFEAKVGVDYFYIDPGMLMPKNDNIQLESQPYTYYDLKVKADFNFFGFDFRFKNSFKGSNYDENYVNKETTMENVKDAETRERILNFVGFLSPFYYGTNKTAGLYVNGEYRLFQTKAKLQKDTVFVDKSGSTTLYANQKNLISMFNENYAVGLIFSKDAHGGIYRYAFGYKYSKMEAPEYIQADDKIETISSVRHGAFIYTESDFKDQFKFTAESTYGIASFEKPNGEKIKFSFPQTDQQADQFFFSSVKNTYSYNLTELITLQGYVGYSGYLPMMGTYYSSIALTMGAEYYLYKMSIDNDAVPLFQALIQILTNYLLVKSYSGKVLYAEIYAGAQVGFKIDTSKWFK